MPPKRSNKEDPAHIAFGGDDPDAPEPETLAPMTPLVAAPPPTMMEKCSLHRRAQRPEGGAEIQAAH